MAQNFSIQINIPVSDHVHKYLITKYGKGPFTATRRSVVGSVILSMLSKNNDIRHDKNRYNSKVFSAIIKEDHYLRNGVYIDYRTSKIFNDIVDKMFKEELYCHVIINKFTHKSQYLDCIRNFLKVYDITEEDLKLESVYKDFKRKKQAIQERMQMRISA
jgi:hypothetical protein